MISQIVFCFFMFFAKWHVWTVSQSCTKACRLPESVRFCILRPSNLGLFRLAFQHVAREKKCTLVIIRLDQLCFDTVFTECPKMTICHGWQDSTLCCVPESDAIGRSTLLAHYQSDPREQSGGLKELREIQYHSQRAVYYLEILIVKNLKCCEKSNLTQNIFLISHLSSKGHHLMFIWISF